MITALCAGFYSAKNINLWNAKAAAVVVEKRNKMKISKKTIHIKGMHCPSCEILITDKFKEISNVTEIKSDFKKQEAKVYFTGHLDQDIVNKKIQPFGYEIGERQNDIEDEEPLSKRIFEAFLITIGLV